MTVAARRVGVGLLGTAFMGRAHAHAYRTLVAMAEPLPGPVVLQAVAGRDPHRTEVFAERFGIARASTDWRALIQDPAVTVFDNVGPNHLHAEPTLARSPPASMWCARSHSRSTASRRGSCSSPRARPGSSTCVRSTTGSSPRSSSPASSSATAGWVRSATSGRYIQDWLVDPAAEVTWRLRSDHAGSGALGDLGSHIIDLARFLVGEISEVSGATQTFVTSVGANAPTWTKPSRRSLVSRAEPAHAGGVWVCPGRANSLVVEVNGTHGSLVFDLERLNELSVYRADGPRELRGLQRVLVTDPSQPGLAGWWPPATFSAGSTRSSTSCTISSPRS